MNASHRYSTLQKQKGQNAGLGGWAYFGFPVDPDVKSCKARPLFTSSSLLFMKLRIAYAKSLSSSFCC